VQDPDLTVPTIASQERLTIGYLSRLLRLPSLAPDIVTAIINGKHPPELSAKRLMRLPSNYPPTGPNSGSDSGLRSDRAIFFACSSVMLFDNCCKMLTPKWRPRDFRVRARANSTKNRLCYLRRNLRGPNWPEFREEDGTLASA
jgi:hypothetical protein